MKSIEMLGDLRKKLSNMGYRTFDSISNIPNEKLIEMMINDGIVDQLRIDFQNLFEILIYDETTPFYHKKAIICNMLRGFNKYPAYILSAFCGNTALYDMTPCLFDELAKKLQLEDFKNFDWKVYYICLNEFFSLYKKVDIEELKHSKLFIPKPLNDYKPELLGDELVREDLTNRNRIFMWAEKQAYEHEKKLLSSTSYADDVLWLSKDYGDGYGFDVLSYDLETGKEKLIEVKSGEKSSFILTPNEYKQMVLSMKKDAIYEIQHFTPVANGYPIMFDKVYQCIPYKDVDLNDYGPIYYSLSNAMNKDQYRLYSFKPRDVVCLPKHYPILKRVFRK